MIVDAAITAYVGFAAWRGRRRKLSGMIYKSSRLGVAFASGVAFVQPIGHAIAHVTGEFLANTMGFLAAFGVPYAAMVKLRDRIRAFIEQKVRAELESRWGAVLGGVNGFVTSSAALVALYGSNHTLLQKWLSAHSFLARALSHLLGVSPSA
jgi:hypothetical protein